MIDTQLYTKKATIIKSLLVLFILSATLVNGQWFEQMMYLPDSFSGCAWTQTFAWNQVNDLLYFGGEGQTVVTVDCATDEKAPPMRIGNEFEFWPTHNQANNFFYSTSEFVNSVCTLYAINCQNHQVEARIPIHFQVTAFYWKALAANYISNKVYLVVNNGDGFGILYVIDASINQISDSIIVNCSPPLFNPKHNVAYIFLPESNGYVVDGVTDRIIDTIETIFDDGPKPVILDTLNDRLYLWGHENSIPKLLAVDCSTNQVTTQITLSHPALVEAAIDPINQRLYLSPIQGYARTIWIVDAINGVVEDSISFDFDLWGVKYCALNNFLYVAARDRILIINPVNHQIINEISLGGFQLNYSGLYPNWFLHPLRDKLYLCLFPSYLWIIDCATNQVIKELTMGVIQPGGFLWNPVTNRFYCTDVKGPFVYCFDAETNRALYTRNLPLPHCGTGGLAVATLHNKIYVGFPDGIVVMDGATDTVIRVIWLYSSVRYLAYNPTSDKIYTTAPEFHTPYTFIIDCTNDEILATIRTTTEVLPFFNPRTNKVYITSETQAFIIDGAGDSLVAVFDTIGGDIAFRDVDERVYISRVGFSLRSLAIIDGWTNQVIEYLPDLASGGVIYNSINDRLYCSGLSGIREKTVVLDCASNTIIDTLPIGGGIFYNQVNNKFYSFDYDSDLVVVYDGTTNEIVARLNEIKYPEFFPDLPIWNSIKNRLYVYEYGQSRIGIIRDEIPGVEECKTLNTISFMPEIYPNPAKGVISIRCPLTVEEIKIFDVLGKLVKVEEKGTSDQGHKQEVRISLKGINPGIYFLRVGKETKKFLVLE